ncbi:hypothetical protein AURDEDRAFT_164599 [Auricularia subglabra TFB-10046 SS5]|nr:hypothetical protein AURDEDRAFT_164599 [Auricularia subglabra TFB-10046 SS5]
MRWDLAGFIMALPLVMHVAVCLFFGGLALSLVPEDVGVGVLVIVLSGILLVLYFLTIVLAVWKLESPYSTPLLRRLSNFAHYSNKRVGDALDWLESAINNLKLYLGAGRAGISLERLQPQSVSPAAFRAIRGWLRRWKGESYTSQEQSASNDMDPVALGWLIRTTLDEGVQSAGLHVATAMLHARAKHLSGKLSVALAMHANADTACKDAMARHGAAALALNRAASAADKTAASEKLRDERKRLQDVSQVQANIYGAVADARAEVEGLISAIQADAVVEEDELPHNIPALSCDPYIRRAALRFITDKIVSTDVLQVLLCGPMDDVHIRSLCTVFTLAPLVQFDFNLTARFPAWRRIIDVLRFPISRDGKNSWIYEFVQFFGTESGGGDRQLDTSRSAWNNLIAQKPSELRYACIVPIADLIAEELCARRDRGVDITEFQAAFFLPGFDVSRLIASVFRSSTDIGPFRINFVALCGQRAWTRLLRQALDHSVNTLWLAEQAALSRPKLVAKADELSILRLCALRCMRALEFQPDDPGHATRAGSFADDNMPLTTAVAGVLPESDFADTDVGPTYDGDIPHMAELWSRGRIRDVEMGLQFMAYWVTLAPRVGPVQVLPSPQRVRSRASLGDSRLLEWNSAAEMREFFDLWALRPPLLRMVVIVPMPPLKDSYQARH